MSDSVSSASGVAQSPMPNEHYAIFEAAYRDYLSSSVDMTRSPNDVMNDQFYWVAGKSAADAIYLACLASWTPPIRSFLDLPCGHGRVMRHLVKLFPEAEASACDIDADGIQFCADQFGAHPILSNEDPTKLTLPRSYDLIWSGSLLTHLPRNLCLEWLRLFARHLNPGGIVIATYHGRYSRFIGDRDGMIDPEAWASIKAQHDETGFGYASYAAHAHADYIKAPYGVSLSRASIVLDDAMSIPDTRVFGYFERGWGGNQDMLVLGRPPIND